MGEELIERDKMVNDSLPEVRAKSTLGETCETECRLDIIKGRIERLVYREGNWCGYSLDLVLKPRVLLRLVSGIGHMHR